MSEENDHQLEPEPGWKAGSLPPPPPRSEGTTSPTESRQSQLPRRPRPAGNSQGTSSTRGSTDRSPRRPDPPSNISDFEDVGALIVSGLSKIASYVVSKRTGARLALQMTENEARSVAGPVVRLIVRRFHVNGDVKDALDVGRSADSLLGYGFRVLMGAPPQSPEERELAARAAADRASIDGRIRADLERRQAAVRGSEDQAAAEAAARDAAARAAADGRREHGAEATGDSDASVLDLFEHMEDV